MGLKIFNTNFFNISKQESLRLNFNYRYFFDIQNSEVFPYKEQVKLKYILRELPVSKKIKGPLGEEEILIDLGNIERRYNILINLENVDTIGSDKNIIEKGDIVIPKLQPRMGNIFLNLEHNRYIGSTELIEYSISSINNPYFLYYILTTEIFLSALSMLESGKTHRRVSPIDLFKVKVPLITRTEQDRIVALIEPIALNIKKLFSQIEHQRKIFDKVFSRELGFDLAKYKKTLRITYFNTKISNINTSLTRSTVVQNKPSTSFLKSFLSSNTIFLKDILLKPINRGKQPVYTYDGVRVIKTLNIQNGKINYNDVRFVSEQYLKTNKDKAGVYKNDLLLTSTGMGRGKFALYTEDEICFADSHISIIRFDQNKFIPCFLNYYCQSLFGTEQLKYIEMHIKGTPEIYENQLKYFQIPNFSLKRQQTIVDEIKTYIDKQEYIKKQIEIERLKIDKIIETSVKTY